MWRKMRVLLISSLLVLLLAGCNRNREQETIPITQETFTYEVSDDIYAITADEDGVLYTIRHGRNEDGTLAGNVMERYDMDGTLMERKEVSFTYSDINLSQIVDGKLYCLSSFDFKNYLNIVNLTTWELERQIELPEYQRFEQMVLLGDYLYILGLTGTSKTFALAPGVRSAYNQGEQIFRINLTEENPKPETMKIEFPLGIYAENPNSLVIYQYTEEKGFGFLKFNQEGMSLSEYEWTHGEYARSKFSGCENGYVCQMGSRVLYGTPTGIQVQLLPEDISLRQPPVCQKGYVFLLGQKYEKMIVKRVCLENFIRDNKEIRVLTDDSPNDFPYGCGYQMSTISATPDEFALKVLAGDTDFDLFVLDTRNDCAYNLKENGAFYALNKVDGVKEYLDACFPYIKELAYNEEGDIWMIPVDIDIPGIVYNREFCKKQGVDYSSMNYMEFMELIEKAEAEEPEKLRISIGTILEPMLMQYVSKYDSFDTELFRSHISKLKQIYTDATTWGYTNVYGHSLADGVPVDFYLDFSYNSEELQYMKDNVTASWAYAPIGFPKLEEGISDVGTIALLAVNPKSDNLKETLKYVTEYCNYMLSVRNSFVLAEETTYDMDNAFTRDLYQLMAGGTIEFRMSDDVYVDTFWDYLEGEIGLEEAIAEADRKMKIYKGE